MTSLQNLFTEIDNITDAINTRPYITTVRIGKGRRILAIIRHNLKPNATNPRDVALIKRYQSCLKRFSDAVRAKEGIKT